MRRLYTWIVLAVLLAFPPAASAQFPVPMGFLKGASGYSANATHFDGSTTHIARGAELSGNVDTKVGVVSFWINHTGGNGTARTVFQTSGGNFKLALNASNFYSITGYQSGLKLALTSTTAWTEAKGWHHVLLAWDLATPEAHMYVNGVDDEASSTEVDSTVDYTGGDFFFGASSNPHQWITADVADVYINLAEFVDISNATNRLKFRTSGGKPVDLGSTDCSTPTGNAPIICFTNEFSTFQNNLGSGGNFSETGTLGASTTGSPSD
tara:strand:- start:222 stop:1022 length:801 start_codon:yes stop_codon:yes gene_type:complete